MQNGEIEMKLHTSPDYTEIYMGVGMKTNEALAIEYKEYYTVYALFADLVDKSRDFITNKAGNKILTIAEGYEKTAEYSKVIKALGELICNEGLCGFRNLLKNHDAYLINKYIIQLLRYCKDDISQFSNIVVDSTVESILASLAFPRNEARKIYVNDKIAALKQLPHVKFRGEGRESLGYILYFMEKSFGIDCRSQKKLNEVFEMLMLGSDIWEKYDSFYNDDILQKTKQQQIARYIFENTKSENQHVDPAYVRTVLRKMENYYPKEADNLGIKILNVTNRTLDEFMERDGEAILNIMAEVGGLIFDGRTEKNIKLDNMMEDIQKDLYNVTGINGNDFNKNKVDKKTKDQVETVHS